MLLRKIICAALVFLAVNCLLANSVCARQAAQYTVQVETLSFEPAARAVANRLNARGYEAYFESHTDSSGKVLYKVRFGRFATRGQADAAARSYREREKRSCFVVQTMQAGDASSPAATLQPAAPSTTQVSLSDQTPARPKAVSGDVRSAGKGEEFYTVQIAAKKDRTVAQALVDRLLKRGYSASIVDPAPETARPFHRVRFGAYESRALAEQAGREYAAREGGDYLIVLSSGGPRRAIDRKPSVAASSVPPAAAGSFYTVQLSVCQKHRTAENFADTLRSRGFDPYIMTHETESGKKLYRVRMGKFKDRAGAAELARAYQQQGGADFIIVRTADNAVQQSGSLPAVEQSESKPERADTPQPVKASVPEVEHEAEINRASTPEEQPEKSLVYEPVAPALQNSVTEEPLSENQAGQSRAVTKIYAYTDSDDRLNLTNAYVQIPGELISRIQYISVFPVRLVSVPDTGNEFVIEVEGRRRRVLLSGIRLPDDDRGVVSAAIQELLTAAPLRLKYAPEDERKDLLTGTLYYRSGTDLQIELVKRGLAYTDEGKISDSRREDLRAAQQRARDIKSGIWSKSTP